MPTATCKDPIIDEVIEMMRDELRVTDRSIIFTQISERRPNATICSPKRRSVFIQLSV